MMPSGPDPSKVAFAHTDAGQRLAYSICGVGYPLVRAPHWLTHLMSDWQPHAWGPWLHALSAGNRLLRFDPSGTGLSDTWTDPISLDSLVDELAAVVDAAQLSQFALLGMSQGAAVSIRYAARHPERVSHLIVLGGYVRGTLTRDPSPAARRMVDALCEVVEHGWAVENSAFRQIFSTQFFPGASREQIAGFNQLEAQSCSAARAAQMIRGFSEIDAREDLAQVQCPTLVFHTRGDARIPFEEGRYIASGIRGAGLVPLAGVNHLPLHGEPEFDRILEEMRAFLPAVTKPQVTLPVLNARDKDLLDLVACGLDNAQIAAWLGRAEKTVRNRVSALFDTLQVENRGQAIVLAQQHGLGKRPQSAQRSALR